MCRNHQKRQTWFSHNSETSRLKQKLKMPLSDCSPLVLTHPSLKLHPPDDLVPAPPSHSRLMKVHTEATEEETSDTSRGLINTLNAPTTFTQRVNNALCRKACRHEVTRKQKKCKLKDEIRMLYVIFSFWGQQSLQSPATRGLDLSPSEGQTTTDQFL